jgi:hypothetical protein
MRIYLGFSGLPGDGVSCEGSTYHGRGGGTLVEDLMMEANPDGWLTVDHAVVGREPVEGQEPRQMHIQLSRVAFVERIPL